MITGLLVGLYMALCGALWVIYATTPALPREVVTTSSEMPMSPDDSPMLPTYNPQGDNVQYAIPQFPLQKAISVQP
jgi:hypothetical protein